MTDENNAGRISAKEVAEETGVSPRDTKVLLDYLVNEHWLLREVVNRNIPEPGQEETLTVRVTHEVPVPEYYTEPEHRVDWFWCHFQDVMRSKFLQKDQVEVIK